MSRNRRFVSAVALVTCFGGACGGSNDGEAATNRKTVRNATISQCPGGVEFQSTDATSVAVQGLVDEDAGMETPETCVEWERVGDRDLRLKFTGVAANCSVDWDPRATFESATLDVILFNQSCIYAGCGCPKDVELTVEDLTLGEQLSLTLHQDEKCKDEVSHPDHHRATLEVGTATKGMLCMEMVRGTKD